MNIQVIKVGGGVVEDAPQLAVLLDNFCSLPGNNILVHGGGRLATKIATQMGVETQMVDGRRITSDKMLSIVTMVYAGLVNKNIVAHMQARGINALGLSGADMDIIRSHRRTVTDQGIDFGWVGDIDTAHGDYLLTLLHQGITPVIAPLTHDGQGHLLNTNADTIAAAVACALVSATESYTKNSVTLTYCFELPGVMKDPNDMQSAIPTLHEEDFHRLVADKTISGGMIPKLENAFDALHHGIERVVITSVDNLQGGTCLLS